MLFQIAVQGVRAFQGVYALLTAETYRDVDGGGIGVGFSVKLCRVSDHIQQDAFFT